MSNREANSLRSQSPGFVISAGTQVVLRVSKVLRNTEEHRKPGSVGIVVECPHRADGNYVIEFADGQTAKARFDELSLRREEVDSELKLDAIDLRPYIIYRCQVGSKAYGLDHENSDDDLRGLFLPPARLHWSLYAIPEQIESMHDGQDEVYWEVEKFLRLALKANPNALELLWTPLVLEANELARELRNIRDAFLSKHLYKTYSGYVLSQFRRMKNQYEKTDKFKVKHAMHLIRLSRSGIHALRTGNILVDVGEHRDELLNIRSGNMSFEDIQGLAIELDREFQDAYSSTSLPEQPNFESVDSFLINARRRALDA